MADQVVDAQVEEGKELAGVPDEQKPAVEIEAREESDVFEALDQLDEKMIIKELEGAVANLPWVYGFRDKDGNEHYELTKDGIDECLRQLSDAGKEFWRETDLQMVDGEDAAHFTVQIERWMIDTKTGAQVLLDKKYGAKRQAKLKYSRKQRRMIPDPFWFEAGVQKAIRNANKRYIPIVIKTGLVAKAKEANRVMYLRVNYHEDDDGTGQLPQGGGQQSALPSGTQNAQPSAPPQNPDSVGAYTLSPKQQKMVYAILGRALKGSSEVAQAWENIMEVKHGHRVKHEFPTKDAFEEFLAEIRRVESPEDYAKYMDILRNR